MAGLGQPYNSHRVVAKVGEGQGRDSYTFIDRGGVRNELVPQVWDVKATWQLLTFATPFERQLSFLADRVHAYPVVMDRGDSLCEVVGHVTRVAGNNIFASRKVFERSNNLDELLNGYIPRERGYEFIDRSPLYAAMVRPNADYDFISNGEVWFDLLTDPFGRVLANLGSGGSIPKRQGLTLTGLAIIGLRKVFGLTSLGIIAYLVLPDARLKVMFGTRL